MSTIENSKILALTANSAGQKVIGDWLRTWGCRVEAVFTPRDLLQLLLRREFDVVLVDAAMPGYDGRLQAYARTLQPWLQWLLLGRPAPPAGGAPDFYPAPNGIRLENPPPATELRRQVAEALRRKQEALRAPLALPLNRMLFFLEHLRAFLPELMEHHQSFPLLDYLRAALSSLLPCQAAAVCSLGANYPTLKIIALQPVSKSFREQLEEEIMAGFKLLTRGSVIDRAVVIDLEGPLDQNSPHRRIGSLCVIPLVSGLQFQGFLAFAAAESRAYSEAESSYICHLANHLARIFPDLAHIQTLAVRDDLTGLNNRRSFEQELRRAWQLSQRYHYPLGLLLMDLDKFKALNDNYGHMIGDAVLKEFARILEGIARRTDVLARYGGDEFAAILTNTQAEQAQAIAQRIRDAVAGHVFCEDRHPLQIGVSIGAAGSDHPGIGTASDLVALADRACYLAKDGGVGGVGTAHEVSRGETPMLAAGLPAEPSVATRPGTVMIIDDEAVIGALFARMLTPRGFTVLTETQPRRALERIREMSGQVDVALIDLKMPEMSGLEVIQALKAMAPEIVCMVLTGFASVENTIAAMRAGAYDFIQKPVNFEELTFLLQRGVEYRRLRQQVENSRQKMEEILDERTRLLRATAEDLENSYMATLEALGAALKAREPDTNEHARRVADYAVFLARRLQLSESQILEIRRGALLHDIGKIGIPDAILQKTGPLTADEQAIVRRHAVIGWQIVKTVPFLQNEAELIYQHHERFDGSGYPRGLAGTAIALGARLFALADTFDTLRSDRVYRKAVSLEAAVVEIRRQAGAQFDPALIEVFLTCYQEMDGL